jgi:hypothetical protein
MACQPRYSRVAHPKGHQEPTIRVSQADYKEENRGLSHTVRVSEQKNRHLSKSDYIRADYNEGLLYTPSTGTRKL